MWNEQQMSDVADKDKITSSSPGHLSLASPLKWLITSISLTKSCKTQSFKEVLIVMSRRTVKIFIFFSSFILAKLLYVCERNDGFAKSLSIVKKFGS